jgi:hypothetical protein
MARVVSLSVCGWGRICRVFAAVHRIMDVVGRSGSRGAEGRPQTGPRLAGQE